MDGQELVDGVLSNASRLFGVLTGAVVLLGSLSTPAPASMIADATLSSGSITVTGRRGASLVAMVWSGDGMAGTARISARASRLARRRGDSTGASALVRRMQSTSGWWTMPDDGDRIPAALEWVLLALMLLTAIL